MADLILTILFGIMFGSIYAAVALGLVLVFGVTDIVNFAHGELVTFGAFGVILLTPTMGFGLALLITLVGVGVIAFLMYAIGFRHTVGNHLQALVFSLALLLIISNVMLRQFSADPRIGPTLAGFIPLGGIGRVSTVRVVVLVTLLALVGIAYWLLQHSWVGVALRACGDDGFAAASIGLSSRRVGRYAFVASGVLAAAAGVGIAAIYPVTPFTGVGFLLKGFVVVVIGGLGSVPGALVAALMFGVLESLGATYINPSYTNMYGFVLMIAILLIRPQGLFHRRTTRA